jgi:ATP-dependent RNA helicase MSS116, mitochondrial
LFLPLIHPAVPQTLAFLLPTLQRIMEQGHSPKDGIRMLVISPTRELASQIHSTAEILCHAHKREGINCQVMYGGTSKGGDLQRMDRQLPTVLVSTPGRLLDHLHNSSLRDSRQSFADALANIDVLVLDEMDRLLDMGFREDIRRILDFLPPKHERQTLLFSATVPPSVQDQIRQCLNSDYETVDCIQEDDPSTHVVNTVQQSYVTVPANKSVSGVLHLIETLMQQSEQSKIIVFCNTTAQVAFFASLYRNNGGTHRVLELHSRISQDKRSRTSDRFRNANNGILFTSDVSARGVDYPNVTHVLQVGSASDRETYIHRLGRTGRAGKSGEGILVLNQDEVEPLLHQELNGIDISANQDLQDIVDTAEEPVWLVQALGDYDMEKKAADCYRSLMGFYVQRFKQLGLRRAGDRVVDLINGFADEAGLKERPDLPFKVVKQYGLIGHPGINYGGGGGVGGGGSSRRRSEWKGAERRAGYGSERVERGERGQGGRGRSKSEVRGRSNDRSFGRSGGGHGSSSSGRKPRSQSADAFASRYESGDVFEKYLSKRGGR